MQEETTALGVPCLTLRENTERPITVEQGTNTLVGRDRAAHPAPRSTTILARRRQARPRAGALGRPRRRAHRRPTSTRWLRRAVRGERAEGRHGMNASARRRHSRAATIVNALTIDVEDYFQVSAFAPHIPRDRWDTLPCRVERNVDRILALLDEHDARATFFTLGWIAERYPRAGAPHRRRRPRAREPRLRAPARERAGARRVPRRHPRSPRRVLEDIGGRAGAAATARRASRSGPRNLWAFDCIARGRLPLQLEHLSDPPRPLRRCPTRRAFAHEVRAGLLEMPVTTVRLLNRNWPAGGGGYLPAAAVSRCRAG